MKTPYPFCCLPVPFTAHLSHPSTLLPLIQWYLAKKQREVAPRLQNREAMLILLSWNSAAYLQGALGYLGPHSFLVYKMRLIMQYLPCLPHHVVIKIKRTIVCECTLLSLTVIKALFIIINHLCPVLTVVISCVISSPSSSLG